MTDQPKDRHEKLTVEYIEGRLRHAAVRGSIGADNKNYLAAGLTIAEAEAAADHIAALRETVAFYAEARNWSGTGRSGVGGLSATAVDRGDAARAALGRDGGTMGGRGARAESEGE